MVSDQPLLLLCILLMLPYLKVSTAMLWIFVRDYLISVNAINLSIKKLRI